MNRYRLKATQTGSRPVSISVQAPSLEDAVMDAERNGWTVLGTDDTTKSQSKAMHDAVFWAIMKAAGILFVIGVIIVLAANSSS